MMKNLIMLSLLVLFSSCENVAKFNVFDKVTTPSASLEGKIFPNQVIDGQQSVVTVKLSYNAGAGGETIRYEIIDEDGNLASDYFISAQGTASVLEGESTATIHITSSPNSIPTGSELFTLRVASNKVDFKNVGEVKVMSALENPITIDTVSIVTLANNGYANIANQGAYSVSGVCSFAGGNIVVTVGTVTNNATCGLDHLWSMTLNLSTLASEGTLNIHAVHSGTNVPGSADRQIIRDVTAPTVSITTDSSVVASLSNQAAFALAGVCGEGSSVAIQVTSSGGGTAVSDAATCSSSAWLRGVNVSGLNDGTLTVNVSISDLAGNTDTKSQTFVKNTIAPTLAISSPDINDVAISTDYTTLSVVGTCNKSGATIILSGDISGTLTSTCNGTSFNFSNLEVTGADGFKYISAIMTDAFGNTAYANTILLKHITLPAAFLSGLPAATSNQEILNVTVSGTLVSQYRYKLGNSSIDCSSATGYSSLRSISIAITDNLGVDENKRLCVVATDTYGNNQDYASATVHTWLKDTSVPILSINSPTENAYVNSLNLTAFTISGDCGINGTNNVVLKGNITATTYANCVSGAYSANVNFTPANQGPVFIIVEQTNPSNGNTAQASRIFLKDSVLPEIAFSTPAANDFINKANREAFAITGTCNEYSATPNIVVTGGTSTVNVACSGTTWSASVPFADETNATPEITVTISDVAGNSSQASRSFIQDTVNPTVAITTPTNGSYVNNANQGSYALSGSCSGVGSSNIEIKNGATTLATANCTSGTPNWTASVNVGAVADGALTLTVEHTEASTNKITSSVNLTKDTVLPSIAWTTPLENICVSASTSGSFEMTGSCTDGDGTIQITSTTPAINETATCSSGSFSRTININTTGLTNQQSFSVIIAQADAAGNSASGTRSFKFITGSPALSFGGWEDVYAIGRKTYHDGTASEDGVLKLKWKEWPSSNVCIPNAVRVYRSETPTGSQAGALVSSDIPSENRNFEDETLTNADFTGKAFYYGLKAKIAGDWVDVTSSPVSEIRVVAPVDNMALVHRWIANQETCSLIGRTSDEANHYRCPYTGRGQIGGFNDMQHDLLVDRFELGCNVNSLCGSGGTTQCVATNFLSVDNPSAGAGIAGNIGAVYYNNTAIGEPGSCWYKYGAANTNWRATRNSSGANLLAMTTTLAHAPPLVYITRDTSFNTCQLRSVDLGDIDPYTDNTANADGTLKRLLRKKEFHASAAWSLDQTYPSQYTGIHDWISYLEAGNFRSGDAGLSSGFNRSGKCNTNNNRHGSMGRIARGFQGGFETHQNSFETGSILATSQCQSRYGIQDLVGNVWEWGSDEVQCSNTFGDTCVGLTSSRDSGNTFMNGFAWNEIEGPGDRRYLNNDEDSGNDVTTYFTANEWVYDTTARNGTTYFNAILGLPLMSNDGGGSVLISAFSSAGHFHGDYMTLYPQITAAVRGVVLGGNWSAGTGAGRWTSGWHYAASNAYGSVGSRCSLPVK